MLRALCAELRPSLEAVRVAAELLERQTLPPEAAVCVRTLLENGARLERAATQAEDLARPDLLSALPEPVDLQALVDDLQAGWSSDGQAVLTALDGPRDVFVSADPNRLRQLLDGLVRQALEERGRRGPVELALGVRLENGRAHVTGRVRGPGEFHGAIDREPTWGALNSAFCRALARAMGGDLTVVGGGSAFSIELAEASAGSAAAQPETENGSPALHVLIVDDNATNRLVAEAFCDMFGCTSDTAADGLEALEAVSRRTFDLILMDIRMPRMDGLQATAAIRALPGPEHATPIIALTANADPEDVRRYLAAGMLSVVEKPIKADRLAEALNSVIAHAAERTAA